MNTKMVLVVRRDLKMRKGKVGAQCAHAALGLFLDQMKLDPDYLEREEVKHWLEGSFRKICVYVDSEEELLSLNSKAKDYGVTSQLIKDNGYTEFHGVPTYTVLAIGPDWDDVMDLITKDLPLY